MHCKPALNQMFFYVLAPFCSIQHQALHKLLLQFSPAKYGYYYVIFAIFYPLETYTSESVGRIRQHFVHV